MSQLREFMGVCCGNLAGRILETGFPVLISVPLGFKSALWIS